MSKTKLGVNIDHVATLREARKEGMPDPIAAAKIALKSGADGIVAHLREDRRHIQDDDIINLRKAVKKRFNLEMSLNHTIVSIALKIKPDQVTLVPERRQEVTTEGGLDVVRQFTNIHKTVRLLQSRDISVSLFIDPVKAQVEKAKEAGVQWIEIHTGAFDRAKTAESKNQEFLKIKKMAILAKSLGLRVAAGHGLKYHNVKKIAGIKEIEELNIGHSIISHAVFVGLSEAVKEMKKLI